MQRSTQVNKSMHVLFDNISLELVSQGIDRRTIILDLEGYDCPVTPKFIKEVWRSIMYTMYRKTSTADLTNAEVKGCYEVFMKFMGENYGLTTGWPSVESLYLADWYEK